MAGYAQEGNGRCFTCVRASETAKIVLQILLTTAEVEDWSHIELPDWSEHKMISFLTRYDRNKWPMEDTEMQSLHSQGASEDPPTSMYRAMAEAEELESAPAGAEEPEED